MNRYVSSTAKHGRFVSSSLLILGILGLFPGYVYAYIDPGTSSAVFSVMGQVLAVLCVFLGIFFRPIFKFFKYLFNKGKEHPRISIPLVFAVGLGVLIGGYKLISPLLSTSDKATVSMEKSQGKKVIVLGMDGLDPKIAERLMAAGELPNFSNLKETGGYSPLQTSNPTQSPVAWSCLATGCNPGKHDIFDFIKRDPKTYLPDLAILKLNKGALASNTYTPVRKGTPFWEITAAAGIPSTVVRWPITFPPRESKARVFAGLGVPDIKGSLGNYTFYTTQPVAADDEGKHKVIVVTPGAGAINTEILGPTVGLKKEPAKIPFSITQDKANKQVTILLDGQSITLKEKSWSDWVELSFKVGFFKKIKGIVKFYLTQTDPLKLYLTPVEVHPREPVYRISNPDGYAAELAENVGLYHTLGMPEDTRALSEGRFDEDAFLAGCEEIMHEREKMLDFELSRFSQGLLAFVFDTTDRVQHMFWHYEEPELYKIDKAKYEKYKDVVESYYRWMDKVLETVLTHVDKNTTLIVCSDHGFSSFRRAVHVNSWLVESGFMTLTSTPEERKDNTLFSDVDWHKTKAYCLGFGSIYLNLQGRERDGIVSPDEARELSKEIARKMLELTDPLTGDKAVKGVYLRDDIYSGPYLNDAPDLVIGFRPGYRVSWQTAIGGAPNGLFYDNTKAWSGDHCIDPEFVPGILFANRKIQADTPRLIDIAPTVLDVLGLAIPADMDGKSLFN